MMTCLKFSIFYDVIIVPGCFITLWAIALNYFPQWRVKGRNVNRKNSHNFLKHHDFPRKATLMNSDDSWTSLPLEVVANGGACMPLRITRRQCTGLSLSLLSSLTRTIYYLHHQKKVSKTQRNSKLLLRHVFRDFLAELPTLACVL